MSAYPVVGTLSPDLASDLLGTGFGRFESPTGIMGLAKVQSCPRSRLDLLAVVVAQPGKGQFRRFIAECQGFYATVCVWEDWNERIGQALARYGFRKAQEIDRDSHEAISGWRWDRR